MIPPSRTIFLTLTSLTICHVIQEAQAQGAQQCVQELLQTVPSLRSRFSTGQLSKACDRQVEWKRESERVPDIARKRGLLSPAQGQWLNNIQDCKDLLCICSAFTTLCDDVVQQITDVADGLGNVSPNDANLGFNLGSSFGNSRNNNRAGKDSNNGNRGRGNNGNDNGNRNGQNRGLSAGSRGALSSLTGFSGFSRQRQRRQAGPAPGVIPKLGRAVRKEYRMMTEDERERFHRAMNTIKTDMIDDRSKYDILTVHHTPEFSPGAHFGPALLPFHRELLKQLEISLRMVDVQVGLPYWDSTLDQLLPNPADSILWTEKFFGNAHGEVTTGPYSNWTTIPDIQIADLSPRKRIMRSAGTSQFGGLYKPQDIQTIRGLGSFKNLTYCVNPTFELIHGTVHMWIGGHMGELRVSPNDPTFFLLHSYVDYLWHDFQRINRKTAAQMEAEYPTDAGQACNSFHQKESVMKPWKLTNQDGMSADYLDKLYRYEPAPSCSRFGMDCESPYLFCYDRLLSPLCVSKVKEDGNCTGFESFDICYEGTCVNGRCKALPRTVAIRNRFVTTTQVPVSRATRPRFFRPSPKVVELGTFTPAPATVSTPTPPPPPPRDTTTTTTTTLPPTTTTTPPTRPPPTRPPPTQAAVTPTLQTVTALQRVFTRRTRAPFTFRSGRTRPTLTRRPSRFFTVPTRTDTTTSRPIRRPVRTRPPSRFVTPAPMFTATPESQLIFTTDDTLFPAGRDQVEPGQPDKDESFEPPESTDTVWLPVMVLSARGGQIRPFRWGKILATHQLPRKRTLEGDFAHPTDVPYYTGAAFAQVYSPFANEGRTEAELTVIDERQQPCVSMCLRSEKPYTYAPCQARVILDADPRKSDDVPFTPYKDQARYLNWNGDVKSPDQFLFVCHAVASTPSQRPSRRRAIPPPRSATPLPPPSVSGGLHPGFNGPSGRHPGFNGPSGRHPGFNGPASSWTRTRTSNLIEAPSTKRNRNVAVAFRLRNNGPSEQTSVRVKPAATSEMFADGGGSKFDPMFATSMFRWCTRPSYARVVQRRERCKNASTSIQTSCHNKHECCSLWASVGECMRNSWMRRSCQRACFVCNNARPKGILGGTGAEKCRDFHPRCEEWTKRNFCGANRDWMGENCRKSCSLCNRDKEELNARCGASKSSGKGCTDQRSECPRWASERECRNNPWWMKENCARSCNAC